MKFSLVFENSADSIQFETVYNSDLLLYFLSKADEKNCNSFSDDRQIATVVDKRLNELHNSLCLTNSMMPLLCGIRFAEKHNLLDYLDQSFLNRQHEQWVLSQKNLIDIDQLRYSANTSISKIGWRLHDMYPDEIRHIGLAEAMTKLGYIFPYEEVNLTVHRLEHFFASDIEFKAERKWQIFDNPFQENMISNNSVVNFSFGYTYVGRQFYNKWQYWDTALDYQDHYNYETLEFAFQLNLDRPQTIAYSPEFIEWHQQKGVKPITNQIPIANVVDLEKNLTYYRTMLYKNSLAGNQAKLIIN